MVIIGLVMGGILVGRNLVEAAGIKAQIDQIIKYEVAVNTFRGKYGYLPGDIPDPAASQFGFVSRGIYAGTGDGNGVIEGLWNYSAGTNSPNRNAAGETILFWRDLSTAHLIEDTFNTATATVIPTITTAQLPLYFPASKFGGGYITAYGYHNFSFGVARLTGSSIGNANCASSNWCYNLFSVAQMYAIDSKMDDGLPASGKITAGGSFSYVSPTQTNAQAPASGTCADNGNVGGKVMTYSVTYPGNGLNCYFSYYSNN